MSLVRRHSVPVPHNEASLSTLVSGCGEESSASRLFETPGQKAVRSPLDQAIDVALSIAGQAPEAT
jgi:hypothetical protein